MPSILLTGVCTLDIINHVSSYPAEDSEVRANAQTIRTGGNACNASIVMQQLGIKTSLLANRADDRHARLIFSKLQDRHIDTSLCPTQSNSSTPTSYITLNQSNGSRTIVHYRDLDELSADSFLSLNLRSFDWLHFEARNCNELIKMLTHSQSLNIPTSIELEKPRDSIDDIMVFADVLLISKPFAESRGFTSAIDCLTHFSTVYSDKIITCTWGEQGAWAYDKEKIIHQPAFKIKHVVETIGAGDTFNAAFIASQLQLKRVNISLEIACGLAGQKCQQSGFDNLQPLT